MPPLVTTYVRNIYTSKRQLFGNLYFLGLFRNLSFERISLEIFSARISQTFVNPMQHMHDLISLCSLDLSDVATHCGNQRALDSYHMSRQRVTQSKTAFASPNLTWYLTRSKPLCSHCTVETNLQLLPQNHWHTTSLNTNLCTAAPENIFKLRGVKNNSNSGGGGSLFNVKLLFPKPFAGPMALRGQQAFPAGLEVKQKRKAQ